MKEIPQYPEGTIIEKGHCLMCTMKLDTTHTFLCQKCQDDPNVLTGSEMAKEIDKDVELSRLLTKPSPYI